eukprot:CAMPEP_0204574348 /NCGR_PEP_ID=MMETSP0661-20131031/40546_1 /ASSEMBLY_ACC=CAM_ASM_000606 /TAXON_ID=109239 /ORGANISM="Alexandrium margalefi, Strain AMGDE01CS-322" /LENGTH=163 /DNA_ID=CAMNT_0051582869 /DNA_START=13 /DNA_END=504 /DNA_ORIENTATION=-
MAILLSLWGVLPTPRSSRARPFKTQAVHAATRLAAQLVEEVGREKDGQDQDAQEGPVERAPVEVDRQHGVVRPRLRQCRHLHPLLDRPRLGARKRATARARRAQHRRARHEDPLLACGGDSRSQQPHGRQGDGNAAEDRAAGGHGGDLAVSRDGWPLDRPEDL